MSSAAAEGWFEPLRACIGPLTAADWQLLVCFERDLAQLVAAQHLIPDVVGRERSRRLMAIRSECSRLGHVTAGADTTSPTVRCLMQFICGYHDLDLRDSVGLGHGRLIAQHATPATRSRWLPRLRGGALAGIAITERHGGSQVRSTRTRGTPARNDWLITGTKTWISRVDEADVFIIFFTDPHGRLAVAAIDTADPALERRTVTPSGLAGWSWGELALNDVRITTDQMLCAPGHGLRLMVDHFAWYRPLVTATALGTAAAVLDTVTGELSDRINRRDIERLRDNAAITIGQSHAAINAALLAAINSHHLASVGDPRAPHWGCATKAWGIDIANQTVANLALLIGAMSFTHDSAIAKARRDLHGLLYADGIHDSLYRSAGHALTADRPLTTSDDAIDTGTSQPRP